MHRTLCAALLTTLVLLVAAPATAEVRLPDPSVDWDYQIGGARTPAPPGAPACRSCSATVM